MVRLRPTGAASPATGGCTVTQVGGTVRRVHHLRTRCILFGLDTGSLAGSVLSIGPNDSETSALLHLGCHRSAHDKETSRGTVTTMHAPWSGLRGGSRWGHICAFPAPRVWE